MTLPKIKVMSEKNTYICKFENNGKPFYLVEAGENLLNITTDPLEAKTFDNAYLPQEMIQDAIDGNPDEKLHKLQGTVWLLPIINMPDKKETTPFDSLLNRKILFEFSKTIINSFKLTSIVPMDMVIEGRGKVYLCDVDWENKAIVDPSMYQLEYDTQTLTDLRDNGYANSPEGFLPMKYIISEDEHLPSDKWADKLIPKKK